mmetsp:Transcript_15189/g.16849  ORF Transcript_15189/g.16849 Transcript_15189/m.16849 type:complete len:115 (-) Transcript_15189:161-505(-)
MADKKASSFSDGEATASDTTRKRKAESQDLPLTDDASSTKPKQPKRQGQLLGSVISEEPSVYLQQKCPLNQPSSRVSALYKYHAAKPQISFNNKMRWIPLPPPKQLKQELNFHH